MFLFFIFYFLPFRCTKYLNCRWRRRVIRILRVQSVQIPSQIPPIFPGPSPEMLAASTTHVQGHLRVTLRNFLDRLPLYLSLFLCLSVCVSVCLFVSLSLGSSVSDRLYVSVCVSERLSVCLPTYCVSFFCLIFPKHVREVEQYPSLYLS